MYRGGQKRSNRSLQPFVKVGLLFQSVVFEILLKFNPEKYHQILIHCVIPSVNLLIGSAFILTVIPNTLPVQLKHPWIKKKQNTEHTMSHGSPQCPDLSMADHPYRIEPKAEKSFRCPSGSLENRSLRLLKAVTDSCLREGRLKDKGHHTNYWL